MGIRKAISFVLICTVISVPSCAHYRIVVPEPAPATDYKREVMNVYFWGALEDPLDTDNCVSNAIDEVRVKRTLPYVLATILTLGIWMPLEVEWKCAKPQSDGGSGF